MILGIESSCDDSSIALLGIDDLNLIYHKKISQEQQHSEFGGVVPELAARLHTQALPALLEGIKDKFNSIRAIAVTNEPGLSVSLIGGVSMAKALSIALNVPLIGVNHLVGHIYSLFLDKQIQLPLGVLLVSGGHTMVLDIDKNGEISTLIATGDDSFGESFDKVAKMMGLGYPGGVIVQENALKCENKGRFKFSVPLLYDKRLEYSFSGLKNQVRLSIESVREGSSGRLTNADIADICYAFEETACLHIINKLEKVFAQHRWSSFGIVGGASANLNLRSRLQNLCDKFDCELLFAPLEFCSDNAAMIARVGREKFIKNKFIEYKNLKISPKSELKSL
ncbi:tRNA (adenosine(37)-N6)-threonylcarbamoyltransferase complex transferase subunit TsaD [Campylobacter sp. faydin G-24]|uniref:tRNA N6-adenosine threonylcarbamoyltransferase n=1 Tax=Campylobacter anatolicus TaxID=2829105 RepID=A0ABS5HGY1_9BACT|nr:tRNA (adenosine(37)-N6)-threonylcarbamoyltransferase complex transferase subunit TsaD [Campylobacter anatolicus]MBR8463306.1 tRNA (adenosine(37)-N6)-threonylcarbamoyltransferase complex transferase subunit TsaD [Campylobacter anatolicus]